MAKSESRKPIPMTGKSQLHPMNYFHASFRVGRMLPANTTKVYAKPHKARDSSIESKSESEYFSASGLGSEYPRLKSQASTSINSLGSSGQPAEYRFRVHPRNQPQIQHHPPHTRTVPYHQSHHVFRQPLLKPAHQHNNHHHHHLHHHHAAYRHPVHRHHQALPPVQPSPPQTLKSPQLSHKQPLSSDDLENNSSAPTSQEKVPGLETPPVSPLHQFEPIERRIVPDFLASDRNTSPHNSSLHPQPRNSGHSETDPAIADADQKWSATYDAFDYRIFYRIEALKRYLYENACERRYLLSRSLLLPAE